MSVTTPDLYFKMDEASGNALDAIGSNDLTDNGGITTGTGKINGGRLFDRNAANAFTHADATIFRLGAGSFSISLWLKWATEPGTETFIMKGGDINTCEYCLFLYGSQFNFRVQDNAAQLTFGSSLATATWYHVVIKYDASGQQLIGIINDGTPATTSYTGSITGTANTFQIGNDGSLARGIDGLIDEVGIWKGYLLTSGEVTSLYNSGSGLPLSSFSGGGALTAGAVSISSITQTTATLIGAACTGGTATFTYQFQTSPDNGSNAPTGTWTNRGSAQSGIAATVAPSNQGLTGLTSGTKYWARYEVTDSAGSPATADATPVSFTTTSPAITLTGPVQYKVFQRSGTTGTISIAGSHDDASSHDIEASWNGGSYATIATSVSSTFSGSLTSQPQGQGTLTVRFTDNHAISATVTLVGVGDVFAVLGQSNGSGRGTTNQPAYYVRKAADGSGGLVGSLYGATTYGGSNAWRVLADPTGIGQDSGSGGSVWPPLAAMIMTNIGIPVAIIPTAVGGTTISQWQSGQTLYINAAALIVAAVPGSQIAGVLWWQGEGNAGDSDTTYAAAMATLAASIHSDYGCKLIPCKLQSPATGWQGVNDGIGLEWAGDANVTQGPDLSVLNGNGTHLSSNDDMQAAAYLWWEALDEYFYNPGGGGGGNTYSRSRLVNA